jgi:hypothetical protein
VTAPEDALAAIAADYPNWDIWAGVSGLLYARRLKTSPPVTVYAHTPAELRLLVDAEEAKRQWT